jgi:hypothetical protein
MLAESYKQLMDEKSVTAKELNRLWRYSEYFEYMAGYTQVGYNLAIGKGYAGERPIFSRIGHSPHVG